MKLARTTNRRPAPPEAKPAAPVGAVAAGEGEFSPAPAPLGTFLLLAGLAVVGMTLHGRLPSDVARYAAIGVIVSIALSSFVDARPGFRNLIRPDVMAILALYFLTLFEFLFRQPHFDDLVGGDIPSLKRAIIACLCGFAGLAIGRHLANLRKHPLSELFTRPVPAKWVILIFWGSIVFGFAYMIVSENFNLVYFVEDLVAPRFTQPWGRPKFGDWKALLHEIEMLIFLAPPLAGIIIARRQSYGKVQTTLVALGFLWVLFYGFASGTRNVLASYVVTFLIAYAFAAGARRKKELIVLAATCAVGFFFAAILMLRFREIGLWDFATGNYEDSDYTPEQTMFVDYNLYSIYRLVDVFPRVHPYLGWEIPYLAFIRPIPRAIWHGKPEGMSMTIEDALGVEGLTVSASFVGEAYMSGGFIAVIATGLFFGFATGWWGRLASPKNSEFGILTYASGFFAAVISMRSMLVFTTALLPTAISVLAGYLILKKAREPRPKPRPLPATQPVPAASTALAAPPPPTAPKPREKVRPRWFQG